HYSAFLAAKVFALDRHRPTPAERLNDGRDFVPTNRWVVFGHHFAAIAGPGPLIGPTLAAQFGYLPGTLWILVGVVLGGAVQDFCILCGSLRRDGARARAAGPRARRRPLGGSASGPGAPADPLRSGARVGDHRLRLRRLHRARVAAARAARLPLDIREARHRGGARYRDHGGAAGDPSGGRHPLPRRWWA